MLLLLKNHSLEGREIICDTVQEGLSPNQIAGNHQSDNVNTHQGGPALLLCHPRCASPLGDVIKIIFSVLAMVHPLHTAKNPISLFLVITEPVFRAIQSNREGKRVPGISLTLLSFKLRARQCRPELITNSNYTLCL